MECKTVSRVKSAHSRFLFVCLFCSRKRDVMASTGHGSVHRSARQALIKFVGGKWAMRNGNISWAQDIVTTRHVKTASGENLHFKMWTLTDSLHTTHRLYIYLQCHSQRPQHLLSTFIYLFACAYNHILSHTHTKHSLSLFRAHLHKTLKIIL